MNPVGAVRPFLLLVALLAALIAQLAALPVAADLSRRSYLGLQFDLSDRSGPGLLVSAVQPASTAERAGMRSGDRLTSVGGVASLDNFDELRAELAVAPVGQRIALRWYRGQRVYRVAPALGVLPTETVPGSLVRNDSVSVDGIRQRLIITEPLAGARAMVLYLQGLGCNSLDFWFGTDDPVKQLINGWARAGLATARLEKRGVGDSEGSDCGSLSFNDERRGYEAAVGRLAALGWGERIFVFGHGLGGIIAPLLTSNQVVGIMVYGTVGEPWYDYMMSNFERQDLLAGRSASDIGGRQALRAEFQKGLLFEGLTPAELIDRLPTAGDLEDVQLADDTHYSGRSVEFFEQLASVDPVRTWRRVWQPVLALHGEFDWVSARQDHERIARLSSGKFLSLAGMDHGFLHYDDLEQSFVARGAGTFDPAIVQATVTWIEVVSSLETSEAEAGEKITAGADRTDT